MKILFICGSTEAGKDGVGDYVRMLSLHLSKDGHQCSILALRDKFVNSEIYESIHSDFVEIPIFRIPFLKAYNNIIDLAGAWIKKIHPDIISIQYVPFSFDNKGLPVKLPYLLKKITENFVTHLMFHEIWVGISKISPLKHKILGFFQRKIAQRMVRVCEPKLITTTNELYQLVLKRGNIYSKILPLFSNIKKADKDYRYESKVLQSWGIDSLNSRNQSRLLVLFGTLYPGANIESAIEDQLHIATEKGQMLRVVSIGRIGRIGSEEFKKIASKFENRVQFILYGAVSEYEASQLLQVMDVAISCTPAQHIGKSGVYALLKLHGLPVILPTKDYLPEYDHLVEDWYQAFINRPTECWSASYVARLFEQQLGAL
jgi:glycosyltransferase involved in cell wall biosynthesis